jgi:hypothetical protein
VIGLDTFEHSHYFVSAHETEAEAQEAARLKMAEIERNSPLAGGPPPHGIQDVVWVVGPDEPGGI